MAKARPHTVASAGVAAVRGGRALALALLGWAAALLAAHAQAPAAAPPGAPEAAAAAPAPATAALACPPTPQPPTPEQVQQAAQHARDRGFLWRISKDGHASYLFGTLHVGKLEWALPGPVLRQAIAASDTVALELNPADPDTARTLREHGAASPANAVAPVLRQRIAREAAAACLPAGVLDTLHPLMQVITLTALVARWDGLDPAYAQEFVLTGIAKARNMPVAALETPQRQMTALVSPDPKTVERDIADTLDQLETGKARRSITRMAQAWADGRFDEIENYAQWCDCVRNDDDRASLRRLNDERNPGLAQAIDTLHAAGKQVFVAVGAMHMTGAQGLPLLMATRGYQVQRLEYPR